MNLFPQYVEVKFFNRELINKLELYDVFINKKDWFYKTPGALAFDLYAIVEEPVIIYPFHSTKIPMGLALQLWNDDTLFGLIISIRSSVSLKGLSLTNGVGIIDADFQGEIHCSVENNNRNNYYTIEAIPMAPRTSSNFMSVNLLVCLRNHA